jgi:hypothetical protein
LLFHLFYLAPRRDHVAVETVEKNRAILKPPNSLDAWGAYHRGLWHMYRFTRTDNEQAQHFFQMAIGRYAPDRP